MRKPDMSIACVDDQVKIAPSYAGLCKMIMKLLVEYTGVTSEVILADDGIEVETAETLVDLQLAERLEHGQYRLLWKNLDSLPERGVWAGLGRAIELVKDA